MADETLLKARFEEWWAKRHTPDAFKDLAWMAFQAGAEAGREEKDQEWLQKLTEAYVKTVGTG